MSICFQGKKLLILGGAYLHKKVVEAAHEMGIYTIVVDNVINSPAKKIASKYYDLNVSDVDGIVAMCQQEGVDAVISVCLDFCQIYYQKICQRLNLPCFGTLQQHHILTDKQQFKEACLASGVDVIPSYSEEMIRMGWGQVEYPILVKPALSRGSRGQCMCQNIGEACVAIERAKNISENGRVVIEKYMEGKEDFQVTYLVIDGHPIVVRTADRYLGAKEENMDRVAVALSSPSSNTDLYFDKVHQKVCKLLAYLGIKNAPLFFQGFVDGDTIRFYDPGLRFPGGEYDRVFADIMGINLMKILIEMSFTGHTSMALPEDAALLKGHSIVTLHSTIRPGTIKSITPAQTILDLDGVKCIAYRHSVRETIPFSGDVNQRIAETLICASTPQRVKEIIASVENTLTVLNTEDQDMVFCKFDAEEWRPFIHETN